VPRETWKNLGLALCSLLLAVALAEAVVRAANLGRTFLTRGPLHEYDPRAGWRCKRNLDANFVLPGSFDVRIRCNGDGLRGGPIEQPKPPSRTRIAVLGDSFMWGFGVEDEEVFAQALVRELPDADVVNLAANGYSTVQELVRLTDDGLRFQPDVVVVGFSWNDLEDNFDDKRGGRPAARLTDGDELRIENLPVRRPWKSGTKQWLRQHSRLFGFLEYAFKLIGETSKRWLPAPQPDEHDGLQLGGAAFGERDLYAPPTRELERAWQVVHLLLARVAERAGDARLLVMYVPSRNAVSRQRFRELFGDGPELDWSRPAERLGEIADSLGALYLDLNPAFRAVPDPETRLFLVNNGHWNAAGHAVAARAAAGRLAGRGGSGG
jgi:lysophospholipase L1-like esterase